MSLRTLLTLTNTPFLAHVVYLHGTAQILLIQESCRLAVEICDDLLNYEKFDDNDMPLVIKTAPAVLLFHEIVQPFNVQVMR
jgi:hypothetical protein